LIGASGWAPGGWVVGQRGPPQNLHMPSIRIFSYPDSIPSIRWLDKDAQVVPRHSPYINLQAMQSSEPQSGFDTASSLTIRGCGMVACYLLWSTYVLFIFDCRLWLSGKHMFVALQLHMLHVMPLDTRPRHTLEYFHSLVTGATRP